MVERESAVPSHNDLISVGDNTNTGFMMMEFLLGQEGSHLRVKMTTSIFMVAGLEIGY